MSKKKDPKDLKIRRNPTEISCKGECGEIKPATEEFFYYRSKFKSLKNGTTKEYKYASPYCRMCEANSAAKSRRDKYHTDDGKIKIDQQNKEWRDSNPIYVQHKNDLQNNKYSTDPIFAERRRNDSRIYRLKFPDKKKAQNANWHQKTKKRSYLKRALFATFFPDLKLRGVLRTAICEALKFGGGSKGGRSILQHLPYTMDVLRLHLESLWEPWMNWSNYGPHDATKRTWQIDHIIPQALLPFNDFSHPNFLECWKLDNLRPMCSKQNASRGVKLIAR